MTERIITIHSDVLADGSYGIVIHDGADTVRALTRDEAYAHAQAVLAAAQRAEYDAAVFLQLTRKLGLPVEVASASVQDLRDVRVSLDASALHPLGLEPGATVEGKPYIVVSLEGDRVGQWTPADARLHAAAALELAEVVRLDSDYYEWLRTSPGVEEGRARAAVDDLVNHRPTSAEDAPR